MRAIERDIVSAVLISKDRKILQALKNATGVYPNSWGIIGGGVDEGEDQRAALNREFVEEAGIDISTYPAELVHESEGESEKTDKRTGERVLAKMKFYTYRVAINDKNAEDIKVTLDNEHVDYKWVDASELMHMKLTPPSIELFRDLGYL